MKHSRLFASLLLVLGLGAGCSVSTSEDVSPQNLSGYIDGQPWSFAAGEISAFLSDGQDNFFATLYPAAYTPCSSEPPPGSHLIVSIPKTPGTYDFNASRNMTFVDDSDDNLVSFDGKIIVDDVEPDQVSGGLASTYDGNNQVSGQFVLTVCPND